MTEEQRKQKEREIALREYETVRGGRTNLSFDQFLEEYYGEEAAQEERNRSAAAQGGSFVRTDSPAGNASASQTSSPSFGPKKKETPFYQKLFLDSPSSENAPKKAPASYPGTTLSAAPPKYPNTQLIPNPNRENGEASSNAGSDTPSQPKNTGTMSNGFEIVGNASVPTSRKNIFEQGNTLKQLGNIGSLQEEINHFKERQESEKQKKELRNAQLAEKYAQESASLRMAKRLFGDDAAAAQEFADELHRQGYDTYIQKNHIDVDDMTQWDPKTVNQMYNHLDRFFKKKDYQEFERKQKIEEKMGLLKEPAGGQLPGVKASHDREWVMNHGYQGQAEADAKTALNDYRADKLEQSATTSGEAYFNQLTKKGFDLERGIRNLLDDPEDDVFGSKKVEDARAQRRERAEEEHPGATLAGKATNVVLEAVYGKVLSPKVLFQLPFQSTKYTKTFEKIYDRIPENVKENIEGVVSDLYETVIDAAKDKKSLDEAAMQFAEKTAGRFTAPSKIMKSDTKKPDDYSDPYDVGKTLRDMGDPEKIKWKAADKGYQKIVKNAFRSPEKEKEITLEKEKQAPLTEEQLRYYKKNYDKMVDLALSEAKENPKFTSMDSTEKMLALYDAKKKAEQELRRQAQAL